MKEETIHFDNGREAQEIVGLREEHLPGLEQSFAVKAVARDTWLKLSGAAESVAAAEAFVDGLRRARMAGMTLTRQAVDYARAAYVAGQGAEFDRLTSLRVDVAPGRAPVFPRTFGQAQFLTTIRNNELTFGLGPAGTGKTWLAMAMAVSALLKNEVARIILTRPAVEAGEALGFLPGDLQQKILPYLRPLYDALHDMMPPENVPELVERGVIEVAPLAYMRGRTLNRAFVILDEAQNTTREQMLMFLTRLGFGSKAVVNGDLTQVDLPAHKMPGLLEAEYLLRNVAGVGVVRLTAADVVRHPLVQRIIEAYQGREKGGGNGGTN
ncbi:MAG TPA: PhoH family protein [Kiritimatiellia bacterium]|jgi:phosphate starvation-inducible PhoH-like protein|nr:PhoH family protein [Kiritimatiellia bacterium]OQC59006.1 MAG: PhoH-like protein [Verrucomicrobia bacterium ADurb.Bin018]MBP9572230.1 PhoH family protein [Kiritimatiellia bacterium]HOE00774.1 PhoH family protein [Kiritimatiellia bacterium]HOE37456.1 PhoH family protein [Kiritimatiellia bacterium]